MQSNAFFIIPLCVAYLCVCALWFGLNRKGLLWKIDAIEVSEKPWLDFGLGLLAVIGILGIGQLYSAGLLIPPTQVSSVDQLIVWPLNNLIIYSPIFLVLLFRKQPLSTVFLSADGITRKLLFGLVASAIAVLLFLGLRGEWDRFGKILTRSITVESISYFPAVFLENIAIAFLFVRLRWLVGLKWAIGIPAFLFALAHVPGSIAEGDPWSHIIIFFLTTGTLTIFILYTAYRGRDILWLGLVHYFMDLAIKVF